MATATIDVLLNLVPDRPELVLQHLENNSALAGQQDRHGYSLLHAAVSYNHADLARKLVQHYNVDVNIRDADGDTPLCAAETVDMARLLIEELHADVTLRNDDGETPDEKIDAEADYPLVAAYVREAASQSSASTSAVAQDNLPNGNGHPPPRVPLGINDVRIGTTQIPGDDDAAFTPDPEIRRRIEELAAREDFQSERGQADLRDLVTEVVSGLRSEQQQDKERSSARRRID